MNPEKPGWKTTEFWAMLGAQVIAVGVTLGWVTLADAEMLKDNWTAITTSGASLINAGAQMWKYIQSRTSLKETKMELDTAKEENQSIGFRSPGP